MEDTSGNRNSSAKRTSNSPNVPAKRLKQSTLPFVLISSPRNAPLQNVKSAADSEEKFEVKKTKNVEKTVSCKENKNPVKKHHQSHSESREQPLIIDLDDDDDDCNIVQPKGLNDDIRNDFHPLVVDVESASDAEDKELSALTPEIALEVGDGSFEVCETEKLVFVEEKDVLKSSENDSSTICDQPHLLVTPKDDAQETFCEEEPLLVVLTTDEKEIMDDSCLSSSKNSNTVSDELIASIDDKKNAIDDNNETTAETLSQLPNTSFEESFNSEPRASEDEQAISQGENTAPVKKKKKVDVANRLDSTALKKKLLEETNQKKREKIELLLKKQEEREEKEKIRLEKKHEEERKRQEKRNEDERKRQEKKQEEERKKIEKKQQQKEQRRLKQEIIDEKVKIRLDKKLQKELLIKEKEAEKERAGKIEKEKAEKLKATFANFFVKKDVAAITEEPTGLCQSFSIKYDMRIAPLHRNEASNSPQLIENLDKWISSQDITRLYVDDLKMKNFVPRKCSSTWNADDVDVKVIDDRAKLSSLGRKYLHFHENVRPPYCGTWRKRSRIIKPKQPLRKDEDLLNYEIDSDDEWEEEPGDSLSQSEDENESDDNYEVDNDLFVPHGYLSDGEGDEDNQDATSPETMKLKLKMKEMEFEKEMKIKCLPLKPVIIGCVWINQDSPGNWELEAYAAVILTAGPIDTKYTIKADVGPDVIDAKKASKKSSQQGLSMLSDIEIPWFIRLVHGNTHNKRIIFEEFQAFWSRGILDIENSGISSSQSYRPAKSVLGRTLKHLAKWRKVQPEINNEKAWCVNEEFLVQYKMENISLPNKWKYHIKIEKYSSAAHASCISDPVSMSSIVSSEI